MTGSVLKVKRLVPNAVLPEYMTPGSAGLDLAAAIDNPIELSPGEKTLVNTGLVVELPVGHEGQVRPRSGLAIRHGVTVVNAPGTIDEDYRGEIRVGLINLGKESFQIQPGMRVAQLVVAPTTKVAVEEVSDVEQTTRGSGGFGHTGTGSDAPLPPD